MQLELHQLDLRYETLRSRHAHREQRLLSSLAGVGQQQPIVVVGHEESGRYVVVDGYKRVRALRKLRHDLVKALSWELEEAEALMLEELMRSGVGTGPLEQGWLLQELQTRFGLSQPELAQRFDKSTSWVSRRLGLVRELPQAAQQQVQAGHIGAHAATRSLLPLARAKRRDCETLLAALAAAGQWPSARELRRLYEGWRDARAKARQRIVEQPWLFLRAEREARDGGPHAQRCARAVQTELEQIAAAALRARAQAHAGLLGMLEAERRSALRELAQQVRGDVLAMLAAVDEELGDA